MLSDAQQKNYDFFLSHLAEYLENPIMRNKFAVFCSEELQGVYDSFDAAFTTACSNFAVGDFVIQQIVDTSEIVEFLRAAVV